MTGAGPAGGPAWAERVSATVVRLAAVVVPSARRDAWREEWASEIWHHVNGRGARGASGIALVGRCLGAIPHALWIRREEVTMDSMLQDVRFALRTLTRRPMFAVVVVVTLAMGIGGNTAVFSVVNAVLLTPLPLPTADRLVWLWGREFNGVPSASVSAPDYLDYVGSAQAFEELAAYTSFAERRTYHGGDRPVEVTGRLVSHNLLTALGHEPALGRGFAEAETRAGSADVIMISHGLWGRLFGFDEAVLGRSIRLGSESYSIIGVLPEGLGFPAAADAWLPLTFGAEMYANRSAHFLRPIGLLRDGVSADEAQRELDAVAARGEAAYPETNTDWYPIVQDLRSVVVGSARSALLVLLAAIGAVLLIACANVASLMLARSVTRRGELAVRRAVGASRARMVRQLLTESLVLAVAGGVGGLVVGRLGVAVLHRLQPSGIPRLEEVGLDGTVLLFTAGVSLLVGLAFGLAPALGLSGDGLRGLRSAGRSGHGRGGRARRVLVAAEVSLSFVLLVSAGLLSRSFLELGAVDPGFEPAGVLALPLSLENAATPGERAAALRAVVERVEAVPDIRSAGLVTVLPLSGSGGDTYVYAEERPPQQIRNIENTALIRTVDGGYFRTLGIDIAAGRAFGPLDDGNAPPRVVINEALAQRLYPNESPIGRRMVAALDSMTALEVIGVMADVRQFNLGTPPTAEFLLAADQFPPGTVSIVAKGARGAPSAAVARAAIWEVDPTQPLTRATTLDEMVSGTLAPGRFQALLLGIFSAMALGLAAIGIYGVLSEGVSARRREIGIRMVMGARASGVVQEVVRSGLLLASAGIVVGVAVALGATRLLSTLLYGIGPRDPVTFLVTPLVLLAVVLLSSGIPAARAARVDPARAIRED